MVFFAHLLILEYSDHHQNLISSSLYYPGPLHKISLQSIHNFLSDVVHRQTDRQTNRQTNQRYQKHNLLCQGGNTKQKNKIKRNITWLNPPYSKHVASNIGKQFLNLLDTCFPLTNKLHKILNRNTVKISYRCMPNMKQIISNHNKTKWNKRCL